MKPVNRIRAQLISIVYIYAHIMRIYLYLYYIGTFYNIVERDEIENFWADARCVYYYYILIASIVLVSRDCGVIHAYIYTEAVGPALRGRGRMRGVVIIFVSSLLKTYIIIYRVARILYICM